MHMRIYSAGAFATCCMTDQDDRDDEVDEQQVSENKKKASLVSGTSVCVCAIFTIARRG